MNFHFNTDVLIGALLIVWGASIFIKLIWGIDIPIFKPLLAIFLIYLGLTLLFGPKQSFIYKRTFYTYSDDDTKELK